MPREQFLYEGTKELCDLIDRAGNKAGFGRGQAFEDFLTLTVCTLATGLMEDEYLATVRKGYDKGQKGNRGIDDITQAFAQLVMLMEDNRDYLGDLFCGGISFGQRGEFFTPDCLTNLMAELTIDDQAKNETVSDPCCGSGRMLLAYAAKKRPGELVGQDIDLRCVRMTAINLGLRNLYGYVLWGNSLAGEVKLGYRTGFNIHGTVIRPMLADELERHRIPLPESRPSPRAEPTHGAEPEKRNDLTDSTTQGKLF